MQKIIFGKSDGKRTLITEHKYSDNSKFRGYKIEGTLQIILKLWRMEYLCFCSYK